MNKLIQAANNTFYIKGSSNIGLYRMSDNGVCLIDSGYGDEDAETVLHYLEENHWHLDMILNTHSHADHIGGNNLLQRRTGCKVYCNRAEMGFVEYPIEEGTVMYGAYPSRVLRQKCTQAKGCSASVLTKETLPEGFGLINLPGHSIGMNGFKTPDNVWFLADSMTSETFLENYHIAFLYDVSAYLDSLYLIKELSGSMYIPSHVSAKENIRGTAQANIDAVQAVAGAVLEACQSPRCFDDVVKYVMDFFGYEIDYNLYMVLGSVTRSYLSYLQDMGAVTGLFDENRLLWQQCSDFVGIINRLSAKPPELSKF